MKKTCNVWLGNERNCEIIFLPHLNMNCNPKQFKILGVWFTSGLSKMAELNITDKFNEPKRLFNIWAKLSITPLVEQQHWSHWDCPNLYTYGSCFQTHLTILCNKYNSCALNLYGTKNEINLKEQLQPTTLKKEA